MEYFDLKQFLHATQTAKGFEFTINSFKYSDGRTPRLPRNTSTAYEIRKDTKFYFERALTRVKSNVDSISKFSVEIIVNNGTDRLGSGDLDNYCKPLLDGITSTQKIWRDDKQVDEIKISRTYFKNKESSIILKIRKLSSPLR